MLNPTRRNALLTAACAGAAFGLPRPVSLIAAAFAEAGPETGKRLPAVQVRQGPRLHPERRRLGETSRSRVYRECVRRGNQGRTGCCRDPE
jgi:hypothetical protein